MPPLPPPSPNLLHLTGSETRGPPAWGHISPLPTYLWNLGSRCVPCQINALLPASF